MSEKYENYGAEYLSKLEAVLEAAEKLRPHIKDPGHISKEDHEDWLVAREIFDNAIRAARSES